MGDQASGLLSDWLRRQRIRATQPYIQDIQGQILDFGCGIGTLAEHCHSSRYLGVDADADSIALARQRHPQHRFETAVPHGERFDLIIMLAVIEHIPQPSNLLAQLRTHLQPDGRILMTTPYRGAEWLHTLGVRLKLCSREAGDEHETLFDLVSMREVAGSAGLHLHHYRRFLYGLNQLFVATPG